MSFTKLTICALFLLGLQQSQGQSPAFSNHLGAEGDRGPSVSALEKAANKSLAESDFYSAIKYFEKWLAADSSETALRGYAEASMAFNAVGNAETAYGILSNRPGQVDNSAVLRLADVKFHLAKYAEAKAIYESVLAKPVVSATEIEQAQTGLENCDWAIGAMEESDADLLVENLTEVVNSPFSDFAPYSKNDTLYFTSYRFPFSDDKHNPERYLMKVLTKTTAPGGGDVTAETDFNQEKTHTAHTAFNRSGDVMYYTNGSFKNSADIHTQIFMRKRDASGRWGSPKKLPENINLPGYSASEPAVGWSSNSSDKQEVLFFASDRPNGKGKRDIWYSLILDNGNFSEPLNMGSINSAGDEVTPFYHANSGYLYFSSDGYQTLGGKDIYRSKGKGVDWSAPEHLGHPINSNMHDLYYTLIPNGNTAYFASNRAGAQYLSEEVCCLDIFKIELKKPQIIAVTFNKETGDSLSGTLIRLIELSGTNEELKLSVPGNHTDLVVRLSKKYMLVASKEGFKPDTLYFDSPGKPWPDLWVKKLYLKPAHINLIANVFDAVTKEPILGATARFEDVGFVTSGGSLATGRGGSPLLTDVKTNTESNNYNYMLNFNHRYKVVVNKLGYSLDSVAVSTEGMTESGTIVKNLYLRRGLNLEARAFDKFTSLPLNGTSIRFVELDSRRTQTASNENGNNYNYGLDFERRYRVVITKAGYFPDSVDFTTIDLKKVDFQTITKDLYLRPLKLTVFPPVKLYFDNDEPDKRTLRTRTVRTYEETYLAYYQRKREFIDRYSAGSLSEAEKLSAQTKLDAFFDREVKEGYDNLVKLVDLLQKRLEFGDKVVVKIKGYASPRAASEYNRKLTSRRISSVENYFAICKGGILAKFLKNKQLSVEEEPNGEDKVPKEFNISDIIRDERNSIYSIEASRERRVEIVELEIDR